MTSLRDSSPLLNAWVAAADRADAPFMIPGHKRRAGTLDPDLGRLLDLDIPLQGGLDTMSLDNGIFADAQERAAKLWGADWCRFSTGGSTHGNQTLCLALGGEGAKVALTRSAHRSMFSGLVIAGIDPVWIPATFDDERGLPLGNDPAVVERILAENTGIRAVMVVSPTYVGTLADVRALAEIAHAHDLPLIVDQAWSGHLGFSPDVPAHALALGADAVVISAHKGLAAYTGAAIVLARTERLDASRLNRAFETTHTTSPIGACFVSTDASRALLETRGPELIGRAIAAVRVARERLRAVPGLVVPASDDVPGGLFDDLRLMVITAGAGVTGFDIEKDLQARNSSLELADRDTIVATVTLADDESTVSTLVDGIIASVERHRGPARALTPPVQWTTEPDIVMSPRAAYLAQHETIPAAEADGRVSAELVAPYPPGVPVLVPGERIAAATIEALRAAKAEGSVISYAADPSLQTVQVVVGQ